MPQRKNLEKVCLHIWKIETILQKGMTKCDDAYLRSIYRPTAGNCEVEEEDDTLECEPSPSMIPRTGRKSVTSDLFHQWLASGSSSSSNPREKLQMINNNQGKKNRLSISSMINVKIVLILSQCRSDALGTLPKLWIIFCFDSEQILPGALKLRKRQSYFVLT